MGWGMSSIREGGEVFRRKVQAGWACRVGLGSAVVEWGRWSIAQREELGGVGGGGLGSAYEYLRSTRYPPPPPPSPCLGGVFTVIHPRGHSFASITVTWARPHRRLRQGGGGSGGIT
jgi:hypothetical protein